MHTIDALEERTPGHPIESGRDSIRVVIGSAAPRTLRQMECSIALMEDVRLAASADRCKTLLEAIREHAPAVVMIDIDDFDADRAAAVAHVHQTDPEVHVILLAEDDPGDSVLDVMRLGVRGIVRKGDPKELWAKSIRKVHEGEIWLDSRSIAIVLKHFAGERPREWPQLSPRERQIVDLVSEGCRNKAIAERMQIGEQTVKNHLGKIFEKLGIPDRVALIHQTLRVREGPPPRIVNRPRQVSESPLTAREREIVSLVAQGFKNKDIASELFISEHTVKNHLQNIFEKLRVSDRLELALYAVNTHIMVEN